ncbi:hypothetical protein D4764_0242880 [Takifugu flavidus]|uniref:Ig-like domain-containing protein n=1 Tax=Takifugu flavidus TaxID=433684 RepID=A0A5C6MF95_9TELE|nr:hypothetical protein D4764_0242880 [Takifugu flavidus]
MVAQTVINCFIFSLNTSDVGSCLLTVQEVFVRPLDEFVSLWLTFGGGTKLIIFSPWGLGHAGLPADQVLSQGAQVSWEVDGTEVTEGVLTTSEEEKSGSYSSFSTLTLSKESWMKGENYSCKVNHHGDVQSPSILRSQCKG